MFADSLSLSSCRLRAQAIPLLVGAWLTLSPLALAQDVPHTEDSLLRMIYVDGGWIMYVLTAMSFITLFLSLYFLMSLRTKVLLPPAFIRDAEDMALKADGEGLYRVCQEHSAAGSQVVGAAARAMHENPDADYPLVRDLVESEGNRQSAALWDRVQYLMDIAVISPMLGLLGTVLGMIQAFIGLKDSLSTVRPVALADGVSKALITTAGGLVVGITAMLLYAFFRGRVTRVVTQMESQCSLIVERFMVRRVKRSGQPAAPPPVASTPTRPAGT
jgi:biopolymer transport protein ExbB